LSSAAKEKQKGHQGKKGWPEILEILKKSLPEGLFQVWIHPLKAVCDVESRYLTLYTPNKFVADWVNNKLYKQIVKAATKVLGGEPVVEIKISKNQTGEGIEATLQPPDVPLTETEKPRQVQLSLLPHEVGVPNTVLRSALFGVVKRGQRESYELKPVASWPGTEVFYTGQRLDQGDLDVWAKLVRMAGDSINSEPCYLRFYKSGLLKTLKRVKGRATYVWLDQVLHRLHTGSVRLFDGRYRYDGHLLKDYYVDEETGEIVIELNTKLARVFRPDVLTAVNFEERLELSSDLAKWLHGHLSSHSGEYVTRLTKINHLCGSSSTSIAEFRKAIIGSLEQITGPDKVVSWFTVKKITNQPDYLVRIHINKRKRQVSPSTL